MTNKEVFLRLYSIDDDYIKDLHDNVNSHVFANVASGYRHSRKYLGVLLEINDFSYYAPLSSPKASDYLMINGHKCIRNSILPIIRMVETDERGERSLLGTIKLGNMLPVPFNKLIEYDLNNETDNEYKNLVLKEKRFINRNEDMIAAYAEALYREKVNKVSKKGYLENTFDFREFENYVRKQYVDIEMRCQHKEV